MAAVLEKFVVVEGKDKMEKSMRLKKSASTSQFGKLRKTVDFASVEAPGKAVASNKVTARVVPSRSSFVRSVSSFLKLPGSTGSLRSEDSDPSVHGQENNSNVIATSRIYTVVKGVGKRSRNKLGRIVEPLVNFQDSFGNDVMLVGVAQEIGFKDQDRYDVRFDDFGYASVFDGHGVSAYAADLCMNSLYRKLCDTGCHILPSNDTIVHAYEALDKELRDTPNIDARTGTCAVTVLIERLNDANFIDGGSSSDDSDTEASAMKGKAAWCGDCRALIVNENGSFTALTKDHKVSDNEAERDRVEKALQNPQPREDVIDTKFWKKTEEKMNEIGEIPRPHSFIGHRKNNLGAEVGKPVIFAHTNGLSLQISRSIGDRLAARSIIATPEIREFSLKKGQNYRIILASDGLFDVFTNEQVSKLAWKRRDPRKAAKMLASRAKSRRVLKGLSTDDITAVVLEIRV